MEVVVKIGKANGSLLVIDNSKFKSIESYAQCKADPSEIFYGTISSKGVLKIQDVDGVLISYMTDGTIARSNVPILLYINGNLVQRHINNGTPDYNESSKILTFQLTNELNYLDNTFNGYEVSNPSAVWSSGGSGESLLTILDSLIYDINQAAGITITKSSYVSNLLGNINVRFPYLLKSTFREALTKICEVAMLQCYAQDDGTYIIDTARPKNLANKSIIYIPPKYQFSALERTILVDNVIDRASIIEHNIGEKTNSLLSLDLSPLIEQPLGKTSWSGSAIANNYLTPYTTTLNASVSKSDTTQTNKIARVTTKRRTIKATHERIVTSSDSTITLTTTYDRVGSTTTFTTNSVSAFVKSVTFSLTNIIDALGYSTTASWSVRVGGNVYASGITASGSDVITASIGTTLSNQSIVLVVDNYYVSCYSAKYIKTTYSYTDTSTPATISGAADYRGVYSENLTGSATGYTWSYNTSTRTFTVSGTYNSTIVSGKVEITFYYYLNSEQTIGTQSITLSSNQHYISSSSSVTGCVSSASISQSGNTFTITPIVSFGANTPIYGTAILTVSYYTDVITIGSETLDPSAEYISFGNISYTGALTSATTNTSGTTITLTPTTFSFATYSSGTASCLVTYYIRTTTSGTINGFSSLSNVSSAILSGTGVYNIYKNNSLVISNMNAGTSFSQAQLTLLSGVGDVGLECVSSADTSTLSYSATLYIYATTTSSTFIYSQNEIQKPSNIETLTDSSYQLTAITIPLADISKIDGVNLLIRATFTYRSSAYSYTDLQLDSTQASSMATIQAVYNGNADMIMDGYSSSTQSGTITIDGVVFTGVSITMMRNNNELSMSIVLPYWLGDSGEDISIAITNIKLEVIATQYTRNNEATVSSGNGNLLYSMSSNELIQTDTTYNGQPISSVLLSTLLADYEKGVQTAKIKVSMGDYYYSNGTIAKNKGDAFQIGDIVQINKDNFGNSLVLDGNGNPIVWKITGRKIIKVGYPYQTLELIQIV